MKRWIEFRGSGAHTSRVDRGLEFQKIEVVNGERGRKNGLIKICHKQEPSPGGR